MSAPVTPAPVASAIPAMMASAIHVTHQRRRPRLLHLRSMGAKGRGAGGGGDEGQGKAEKRGGERARQQGFHGSLRCAMPDLRQTGVAPINGAETEQFRFSRHQVELRMSDQQPPPDDTDPAQIWGRRIGRALGWLAAGALLINLFTHWLF